MLNTKLYKGKFTNEEYADLAIACNEAGNLTIEDKGEYYEVVEIPVHVETVDEIKKRLVDGVQNYMDTTVQTRGYDNIHTACTYVSSTDEIFKQEGTACLAWRDNVWRTCYSILNDVMAGNRDTPTLEELITELPKLDW